MTPKLAFYPFLLLMLSCFKSSFCQTNTDNNQIDVSKFIGTWMICEPNESGSFFSANFNKCDTLIFYRAADYLKCGDLKQRLSYYTFNINGDIDDFKYTPYEEQRIDGFIDGVVVIEHIPIGSCKAKWEMDGLTRILKFTDCDINSTITYFKILNLASVQLQIVGLKY